jgi:hypothetical protein
MEGQTWGKRAKRPQTRAKRGARGSKDNTILSPGTTPMNEPVANAKTRTGGKGTTPVGGRPRTRGGRRP